MTRAAYQQMTDEIVRRIDRLGLFQGVYLDMHGAMAVEGLDDAEADFFAAVRAAAGRDALLSASYDLHRNVSAPIVGELDFLTAYRTAPHTDMEETRERAVRLLVDCLREGIRPQCAFVSIPALFSGEQTMTTVEPGRSVYAGVAAQVRPPGVLDASLLVGYVWADQPRVGTSAVACGMEAAATRAAAATLAQAYWDARTSFTFPMPADSVDRCIERAMRATEIPVFISDAGDNVTAGAPGDVPYVLSRLLAHGVARAVVASLVDPAAVAACEAAGVGEQVTSAPRRQARSRQRATAGGAGNGRSVCRGGWRPSGGAARGWGGGDPDHTAGSVYTAWPGSPAGHRADTGAADRGEAGLLVPRIVASGSSIAAGAEPWDRHPRRDSTGVPPCPTSKLFT